MMGFIIGKYYQLNFNTHDESSIRRWYFDKKWDTTKIVQKKFIGLNKQGDLCFEGANENKGVGSWDNNEIGVGKTWMESQTPIFYKQEELDV